MAEYIYQIQNDDGFLERGQPLGAVVLLTIHERYPVDGRVIACADLTRSRRLPTVAEESRVQEVSVLIAHYERVAQSNLNQH